MSRTATAVIGIAVLAAAAGVTWWALSGDEPPPPIVESSDPTSGILDPERARKIWHGEPWPYREFAPDFDALRSETQSGTDDQSEEFLMRRNEIAAYSFRVEARFEKIAFRDLVVHLKQQLKPAGVDVYTYDIPDVDDLTFSLNYESIPLDRLIDELRIQSGERLRYYMTSQGLCIGSDRAVQQAQLDARAIAAGRSARADRRAAILDKEFRPDFSDAWIGPIHRAIREQTGVEVLVDPNVWASGRTLTWRANPVPLRVALDRIAKAMGCVYRVRDDRVWLISL